MYARCRPGFDERSRQLTEPRGSRGVRGFRLRVERLKGAGQSCRSLCLLPISSGPAAPGYFRNERDPAASITADVPYRSPRSAPGNWAVNDKGTTALRAPSLRARPEGLPDLTNLFAGEGDRCMRSIGHDMNVYCGCRGHNGGHKAESPERHTALRVFFSISQICGVRKVCELSQTELNSEQLSQRTRLCNCLRSNT